MTQDRFERTVEIAEEFLSNLSDPTVLGGDVPLELRRRSFDVAGRLREALVDYRKGWAHKPLPACEKCGENDWQGTDCFVVDTWGPNRPTLDNYRCKKCQASLLVRRNGYYSWMSDEGIDP